MVAQIAQFSFVQARRERRAKVIHAIGEAEAAEKLAEAAKVLSGQDQAVQLRYLQTLVEIASEKNSTIVFPLPMDLISMFMNRGKSAEDKK